MIGFYCFVFGMVVAWPIAYMHGVDSERKWWRR